MPPDAQTSARKFDTSRREWQLQFFRLILRVEEFKRLPKCFFTV